MALNALRVNKRKDIPANHGSNFWIEANVIPYLDDILIFSKTLGCHEDYLRNILKQLDDNNIKINYEKSEFLKT